MSVLCRVIFLAGVLCAGTANARVATTHDAPLSISVMRARSYPGSALRTETVLGPGVNYERRVVSYRSDGLRIDALLTVPSGKPPKGGWPAIVLNHGYVPPAVYRTTERYVAYVDAFARAGFVVLKPDYRGHGRSEGTARGASYWNPDYITDVLNAVASLQQDSRVNAGRIGMWGHSMGGHITLRAMLVNPGIKSGVIWAGVVGTYDQIIHDLPKWGGSNGPGTRGAFIEAYGTPRDNAAFYKRIDPHAFLKDLAGRPLQVQHARTDTHVPFHFSQTLVDALKAAKQPVEFYAYPRDDHDLSRNLRAALARSVAFFKKTL